MHADKPRSTFHAFGGSVRRLPGLDLPGPDLRVPAHLNLDLLGLLSLGLPA